MDTKKTSPKTPKPFKLNVLRMLKRNKREGKEGPITLKDLQRKTGIDYSTLHDHAHGRTSRITFAALFAIKSALETSWDDLFATSPLAKEEAEEITQADLETLTAAKHMA